MQTTSALARLLGLSLILLVGAGCSKDSSNPYGSTAPAPSNAPPNTVMMAGMAFTPSTITVAKNTSITWVNNDGVAHTSTSDTGLWDTGNIPAGSSKTVTFSTSGSFPFHCTYHSMMTGTVVVQ